MCNTSMHHRPFNGVVDPFSFSTFHLLRTCNRLMLPSSDIQTYYNIVRENGNSTLSPQNISGLSNLIGSNSSEVYNPNDTSSKSPILDVMETIPLTDEDLQITDSSSPQNLHESTESNQAHSFLALRTEVTESDRTSNGHVNSLILEPPKTVQTPMHQTTFIGLPPTRNMVPLVGNSHNHSKSPLPAFEYIAPATQHHVSPNDFPLMELNRVGVGMGGSNMFPGFLHRRPRGEKRPIPDEQKDDKYYERRKRNNEAAKKSRDARKIREDRIAFRAALLEQENSILRAQVMALRDELQTMRQLMSTGAPMSRGSTT